MKRFRVKMNLDEIKSELNKLESKLSELRQQKHQLFSQLKKVLHEDDMRRRQWNASNAMFTAESQLALAQSVQMATAHNQMFAPQLPPAFNTPVSTPSLQFYNTSNGPNIRATPVPYQPKFNQHMMTKGPPICGPPPPPSINSVVSSQRSLKRPHEQTMSPMGPNRGSGTISPPQVQTSQSHYKPHSVPVTYTPSIASESRHPYPVLHSQHWSPHTRHPFGWSQ